MQATIKTAADPDPPPAPPHREPHRAPHRARPVRLLLLLPFVAMLAVPTFNFAEPALFGLPFFYWYQLLWILICSALIGVVYIVEGGNDRR